MSVVIAIAANDHEAWDKIMLFDESMNHLRDIEFEDVEEEIPRSEVQGSMRMNVIASTNDSFVGALYFFYDSFWWHTVSYSFGFDAEGNITWKRRGYWDSEEWVEVEPLEQHYGAGTQHLVHGDELYSNPNGAQRIDMRTGEAVFEFVYHVSEGSFGRLGHMSGDRQRFSASLFGANNPHVRTASVDTGEMVFNQHLGANGNIFYTIDYQNLLIVGSSWNNELRAFRKSDFGVEWSRPLERHIEAIPDYANGFMYSRWADWIAGSSPANKISKIDMLTGDTEWFTFEIPGLESILGRFGAQKFKEDSDPLYDALFSDRFFVLRVENGEVLFSSRSPDDGSWVWGEQSVASGSSGINTLMPSKDHYAVIRTHSNDSYLDYLYTDGAVETNIGGVAFWDDFLVNTPHDIEVISLVPTHMSSLRLLQRDDDNDHGQPRISLEQVTSEQKSIRRGPGTYF